MMHGGLGLVRRFERRRVPRAQRAGNVDRTSIDRAVCGDWSSTGSDKIRRSGNCKWQVGVTDAPNPIWRYSPCVPGVWQSIRCL